VGGGGERERENIRTVISMTGGPRRASWAHAGEWERRPVCQGQEEEAEAEEEEAQVPGAGAYMHNFVREREAGVLSGGGGSGMRCRYTPCTVEGMHLINVMRFSR
jgi:hypothetical protein